LRDIFRGYEIATIAGPEIAGPAHATADMHVYGALGIVDPVDRSVDGPIAGPSERPDRLATETSEILAPIRDGRHRDAIPFELTGARAVVGRVSVRLEERFEGPRRDAGPALQRPRSPDHPGPAARPRPLTDTGPCDTPLR
jgi:hypothetical protein